MAQRELLQVQVELQSRAMESILQVVGLWTFGGGFFTDGMHVLRQLTNRK